MFFIKAPRTYTHPGPRCVGLPAKKSSGAVYSVSPPYRRPSECHQLQCGASNSGSWAYHRFVVHSSSCLYQPYVATTRGYDYEGRYAGPLGLVALFLWVKCFGIRPAPGPLYLGFGAERASLRPDTRQAPSGTWNQRIFPVNVCHRNIPQ